jgi:superfamily II DNA helicase RecQ
MLVVAESAVTKAFARFIDIKRASHQLERIVIDECHTILESTDEWRPQVRELREMGGKGTQVVFLTATLPPTDEGKFFEAVGLEGSTMKVIRVSTRRTNVAYRVLEYEKGRLEEALRELVSEKMMEDGGGKVVVYCRTVVETKRMAKVLGCMAYYREVGTEVEKRRIQEELVRGKERVFTATNALGLGIDAPSIRAVIHTGVPFGSRQYGQESGRAGRDDLRSEGIVMRWFKVGRSGEKMVERNARAGEEVKTFIRGERCRKAVLEEYMDGNLAAVDCQGRAGEAECDVCERDRGSQVRLEGEVEVEVEEVNRVMVAGREEGRLREGKMKRRMNEIEAEEEVLAKRARGGRGGGTDRWESTEGLRRTLQRYAEECAICVTIGQGKEGGGQHEWWDCREIGGDEMAKVEGIWEDLGRIGWEEYSSCEGCRVPQAVCDS